MHWESALGAAIEVAIAIAGFSGIVAAVSRRNPGGWTTVDQLRLRILLTSSGVAGLFSFLPFVLFEASLSPTLAWRIGSAVQALWLLGIMGYRLKQASLMGASEAVRGRGNIVLILSVVVLCSQIINAAFLGLSWIYIVGVVFQLVVGFSIFATLLLGSSRDDATAA